MSDVSVWINDFLGLLHGKSNGSKLAADSKKLLEDVEATGAGLQSAGPYGPSLLADVAKVTAEGAAVAAAKGLDIPADVQIAGGIAKLAHDLVAAEKAFLDGWNAEKQKLAVVAAAAPGK